MLLQRRCRLRQIRLPAVCCWRTVLQKLAAGSGAFSNLTPWQGPWHVQVGQRQAAAFIFLL